MNQPTENTLKEDDVSPTNLPFGRIYSRMSNTKSSRLSNNEDIKHSMKYLEKVKTKQAPFKKSPRMSPKQLKT